MDILHNSLLVLHFIGLASLLGGFLVQMSSFKTKSAIINPAILHGALTQLVTGLLLVGVAEMARDEDALNYAKIGVKLTILVVIYALALVNRKKSSVATPIIATIGALTIVNIVLAVFW
jgi:hypothetical protein